ncbi:MAG TPA: flippase-like domain-containing protein [bacterium]|nr:flippase-like domain-containing protein [bacterium]
MAVGGWKKWIFGLRLALGIGVLAVLIVFVKPGTILEAVRSPERSWLFIIAAVLLVPNLILQWLRWHLLVRRLDDGISPFSTFASLMSGMSAGFITPGRIGEVSRSLFLPVSDRWMTTGLAVLDKWYAFLTVIMFGGWGVWTTLASSSPGWTAAGVFFLAAAVISVWAVGTHPHWTRNLIYWLSLASPRRGRIKRLIGSIDLLGPAEARILMVLSLLMYFVYIIQFCLLIKAFEPVGWYQALAGSAATMMVKTFLPISWGDLGVREGAAIYCFGRFGVEKGTAFQGAFLLFILNILIPALLGLIFLEWPILKMARQKKKENE